MRGLYLLLVPGLMALMAGCATQGGNSIPGSPDIDAASLQQREYGSHSLWGLYRFHVSDDHSSVEIEPMRFSDMHLNVRTFLEDSPCQNCLSVAGVHIKPGWLMEIDISLKHPFPGQNRYTGFDVRGIAMFDGSYIWPGSGLSTSDSNLGDVELLNPDGYTRIFNPTEYAPGSGGGTIYEYSHGNLAPPGDPNAILNGYIDFYIDENRRYFPPGLTITRTYRIQAKPGGFTFGYAIDACWKQPQGTPPFNIPDDFPISANRPEAYELSFTYQPGMKSDGSGSSILTVDVYDWQDPSDVVKVQGECASIFSFVKDFQLEGYGDGYARYSMSLVNTLHALEGDYKMLVWAEDVLDASDPMNLTAYAVTTIHIDPASTEPQPPSLITVIEDVFHSPFCAKVDISDNKCYINSTQLSPVLDVSIRSIDADENVEDFFFKTFMGGWFGLNPSLGKIISPDFLTQTGNVDYIDIGTSSATHYFVPVDPVQQVAFLSDGEAFDYAGKACTIDTITRRLIVWDLSGAPPDYHEISTADFPDVLEGDYTNDRLFVYCTGTAPEVDVFNMNSETLAASFIPKNTVMPFWTEIDYDPSMGRIYIGVGSSPGYIEVWDSGTYKYIDSIETSLDEVWGIEHLGKYIYCTGHIGTQGKLLMIDAQSLAILFTIDCGIQPCFLAANPNNKKIYVPDIEQQTVWVWQGY